MKGAKIHF